MLRILASVAEFNGTVYTVSFAPRVRHFGLGSRFLGFGSGFSSIRENLGLLDRVRVS